MIHHTDKTEPLLPIGIMAKKFNISVHTLRLYEAEGLILPFKTKTNRRLYSRSDLNRITCIRGLIRQQGLNLAGIKGLLALIPCWDLLPCSRKDRDHCAAYTDSAAPCWTVMRKAKRCRNADCRECKVYQSTADCNNIKSFLKEYWRK